VVGIIRSTAWCGRLGPTAKTAQWNKRVGAWHLPSSLSLRSGPARCADARARDGAMAVERTSGARPPRRARWLAAELTRRGGGLHGEAAMATSGGGVPALAGVPVIGGGRREVLHHRGKEE
jgi:hypothetical protein